MASSRMNPAYRANLLAALEAASAAPSREAAFAVIQRVASPSRLRGMNQSPRAVALRATGWRPAGEAYRAPMGGPASHSYQWVQEYVHTSGRRIRC